MLGVIGDIVQDIVVWQLEPTQHATDTRSEIFNRRGGSAANVAAFAGPRYPTRFIGCVGEDPSGAHLRRDLENRRVDVRLQTRDKTGTIVVLIDSSGERQMFPSRGASACLQPVTDDDLDGLELLHCTSYAFQGGSTPAAVKDAIMRVRAAGGMISIDASSTGLIEAMGAAAYLDLLAELRPHFLSANEDECAVLGLVHDRRPGRNLDRLPGTMLLARAGSDPTVIFRPGMEPVSVPAPKDLDIKDLTGAGDAFNAGFLIAYLTHGHDPVLACEAGHELAARVLANPGATEEYDEPAAERHVC